MTLARPLIALLVILGLSTASFAGDLQDSIARQAQQQAEGQRPEQPPARAMSKAYLVPGAALFVAGMSMAIYGFLHTNGGEFVSGEVSKESKTGLGAAGLGVAAVGGAILYRGAQRASHAPSVTVGAHRVTVRKQVSW